MRTRTWIALVASALLGLAGTLAALGVVSAGEQSVRVELRTTTRVVTHVVTRVETVAATVSRPPLTSPPPRRDRPRAPTAVATAARMYRLRASDPLRAAQLYDHPLARRYGCPPASAARAYSRMRWTPFRIVASRRVDWTLRAVGVRFRDARELTVRRPGGTTTFHMARYRGTWRAFPRC